jgi:hypothetical protein
MQRARDAPLAVKLANVADVDEDKVRIIPERERDLSG